jgi:membrane protease YdiL (CAAX protease family)
MTSILAILLALAALSVLIHRVPDRLYLPLCLVATGGIAVWSRLIGLTWAELGLGQGTWLSGRAWGVAVGGLVVGVVAAGVAIPKTRRLFVDEKTAGHSTIRVAYETGVRLPWGTVLLEETAFRGALLAALLTEMDQLGAVVVSAVAFGLWHVVPSLGRGDQLQAAGNAMGEHANIGFLAAAVISTTVAGAGLAILRLVSDSLLAPMLAHWSLNASALLAAAMLKRRGDPAG